MSIEMIEPTEQPATPTQPTQGVFMDKYQAPNLIGIIMQALEQHIEAMVDKRFTERMAEIQIEMPNMAELEDAMTELVENKMSEIKNGLDEMIDDKLAEHTDEYDHDEYDETVRTVDNADLDDLENKIKDTLRGLSLSINL
jgi:hypothetical protein